MSLAAPGIEQIEAVPSRHVAVHDAVDSLVWCVGVPEQCCRRVRVHTQRVLREHFELLSGYGYDADGSIPERQFLRINLWERAVVDLFRVGPQACRPSGIYLSMVNRPPWVPHDGGVYAGESKGPAHEVAVFPVHDQPR